MKKTISIILTALIFLTLTGCGNNSAVSENKSEESETTTVTTSATSAETENSTITTTETAETTTDTTTETTEETTETESSDNNSRPQKHGYNDNDLYYFDVGNYTVSVPNYWKIDTIDEQSESLFAFSDNGDQAALVIYSYLEAPEPITFDILYNEKDVLINLFDELYGDFGSCEFTGMDIYETELTKGIIFKYIITGNASDDMTSSTETININLSAFIFPCENGCATIHLLCSDNTKYRYDDDFYKILENIKIKDKTTETTTTAPTSSTGVRPEFKEAMESYEEFFDEYCEFMKKYQKSPDDLTLLSDYLEFMSKYDETMTEMENIDTDDLSDEELKLYLETQTRITSKLLSVYNTD